MILSGNARGFLLILFSFIKFLDVWRSLKLKRWKTVERKDIYFALLSLSNALMIVSPLLLLKYSDSVVIKALFVAAALLVCSTLLLPARKDVRTGYYFWVLSFIIVAVAAITSQAILTVFTNAMPNKSTGVRAKHLFCYLSCVFSLYFSLSDSRSLISTVN